MAEPFDFFTIGYEGLGIARFLGLLEENGVRTLLDVRHNPFSRNPDFARIKLANHLQELGIKYHHLKEYGTPGEVRKAGDAMAWYDLNVRPKIRPSILEPFEKPVCFMCKEMDINSCHRKVILETLLAQALAGKDLVPV